MLSLPRQNLPQFQKPIQMWLCYHFVDGELIREVLLVGVAFHDEIGLIFAVLTLYSFYGFLGGLLYDVGYDVSIVDHWVEKVAIKL
jgi:hypothetical protein